MAVDSTDAAILFFIRIIGILMRSQDGRTIKQDSSINILTRSGLRMIYLIP